MIQLTSPSFSEGGTLPIRFAKEGDNVSPRLEWSDVPQGTKELALVCDDPDAPSGTFTHWIIYGIDPNTTSLPEAIPTRARLRAPLIARQGLNSAGDVGYVGPYPPAQDDWHRYRFKLYALKHHLGLNPKVSEEEFYAAIEGSILEMSELTGKYHTLKRLSETPALLSARDQKVRTKLRLRGVTGVLSSAGRTASRVTGSLISAVPMKPVVAIGVAAVAGGLIAYLQARPAKS